MNSMEIARQFLSSELVRHIASSFETTKSLFAVVGLFCTYVAFLLYPKEQNKIQAYLENLHDKLDTKTKKITGKHGKFISRIAAKLSFVIDRVFGIFFINPDNVDKTDAILSAVDVVPSSTRVLFKTENSSFVGKSYWPPAAVIASSSSQRA